MEDRKEIMFKEIDIIQWIIDRMSSNSFLIKWWSITLVVWVVALDKFNENNWILLLTVSIIAILVFWCLDAYYLQQERLYRKLYKRVVENRSKSDDYILNMDTERVFNKDDCILCVLFSKTIWTIYVLLIIILIVVVSWYFSF